MFFFCFFMLLHRKKTIWQNLALFRRSLSLRSTVRQDVDTHFKLLRALMKVATYCPGDRWSVSWLSFNFPDGKSCQTRPAVFTEQTHLSHRILPERYSITPGRGGDVWKCRFSLRWCVDLHQPRRYLVTGGRSRVFCFLSPKPSESGDKSFFLFVKPLYPCWKGNGVHEVNTE